MEYRQKFTLNDIGTKWKSKREIYTVLSLEGEIFLPLIADATQKYLRAIMLGDKTMSDARTWKLSEFRTWIDSGFKTSCNRKEKETILIAIYPTTNSRRSPTVNDLWTLRTLCWRMNSRPSLMEDRRSRELKVIKNKILEINVKDEFLKFSKTQDLFQPREGKYTFF